MINAAGLAHLPQQRVRRASAQSDTFARQVSLIGIACGGCEVGERAILCVILVDQRQEALEAKSALKCLGTVAEDFGESSTHLSRRNEEIGCHLADAARSPRLKAVDCGRDERVRGGHARRAHRQLLLEEVGGTAQ